MRDDPQHRKSDMTLSDRDQRSARPAHIAALALVCAAFYWSGNDRVPLFDRDEPRYAQATREMLESGNWIVPYFNGNYRFDKPILIYWLMAGAYWAFGAGEFAARFVSGAFGAGSVVATYLVGTWMFGRRAGFWSAVALATAPLFCYESKSATPDAMLVCFTTAAFACLWKLLAEVPEGAARARLADKPPLRWAVGFWLFVSLSFLAKGPVGAAVVFFVLAVWSVLRGWGAWRKLHWGWGVAIFLAVNLPWYAAVTWQTQGEFLRVALGRHVLQRMATPLEGHRGFPGMYALSMLLTFSPWVTLVWPALRQRGGRAEGDRETDALRTQDAATPTRRMAAFIQRGFVQLRRADPRFAYLAAWAVGPLLLLEPLQTKLVHYYLPAYPAWALLVGQFLASLIALQSQPAQTEGTGARNPADRATAAQLGYGMLGVYAAIGLVGAAVVWFLLPRPLAIAGAVSWTIGGLLNLGAFFALRRGLALRGAVLLSCVGVWMAACTGWWILPAAGPYRLAHRVARRIEDHAAGRRAVLFGFDEPSTVFYLGGHVHMPRGKAELADFVQDEGPVVSALTDRMMGLLQANRQLRIEVLESLTGYNLAKGREQTVRIVRIKSVRPATAAAASAPPIRR